MNFALFLGSLAAVLATAGMVAWLGLGRNGAIEDAGRLAEDLVPGFESADVYADSSGHAAVVRGRDGSWALLRLQGLHPVVRHLPVAPRMQIEGRAVRIGSGERLFGDLVIANDRLLTLL